MADLVEWPCDIEGCNRVALSRRAICPFCFQARCEVHIPFKVHGCYIEERGKGMHLWLENLLEKLQVHRNAIYEDVSRIRPNRTCTLDIPENADAMLEREWRMLGSFNVNFIMTFDDGVKWVLRIRQDRGHRLPRVIREANIRSEVTTMNLLKANGVQVPAAWLPCHLDQADPCVEELPFDYFFIEFIEGEKWKVWRPLDKPIDLPKEQLELFIEVYAKQQIKMSEVFVPTKRIGCLSNNPDNNIVAGPIIARGTFMTHKPPYLLGPFKTLQERYLAHIRAHLDYLALGAIQWCAMESYLWHLEVEELVLNSRLLAEEPDAVYIKHDDDKGDIFLYDDQKQITGVLDWEWAFTTTKGEAFAPPDLFFNSLDFYEGANHLTDEENMLIATYERYGRADLADCVRTGRLYQRLSLIGRYERVLGKGGLRTVFCDIPPDFNPPPADSEWMVYMMKRYKDHAGLQKIMDKLGWTIERAEEEVLKEEAKLAEEHRAKEAKELAQREQAEKAENEKVETADER
ncbi:hypothetical protein IAT40_005757 [Kwoniella sp. CBS 6097]